MNFPSSQPQPPAAAAEFRQCFKCHYESVTAEKICPRCRKPQFFTASNIRMRGGVVVLCGLFISGLIGGIAVFVAMLFMGSSNNPETMRKLSDEWFTLFAIYGFFAILIGLGLHFVLTGSWMLIFGKRSRVLIWLMWAGLFVVFTAGGLLSAFL